jgi:hypothetical protein
MENLNVDPDHLVRLAEYQAQAATDSASGAKSTDGTTFELWMTHGVISMATNKSGSAMISQRRAAGKAMAKAAAELAKKLRAAAQTYDSVDAELSENLESQMLRK